MPESFLFICNSNAKSGFGHFSRCLNLARWLLIKQSGLRIAFAGNYNEFAHSLLEKYSIETLDLEENDNTKISTIKKLLHNYDAVIIDDYSISQEYVDFVATLSLKSIFIDDFNTLNLRKADLVINFTINAAALNYSSRTNALGTSYFIVKPELLPLREKNSRQFDHKITNVLLFFSGLSDLSAIGLQILKILDKQCKGLEINFITSSTTALLESTKLLLNNKINLINPTYAIEELYSAANLVISGGGLTKYESAYCCIPCAVISINEGQHQETLNFEAAGLTYELSFFSTFNEQNFKIKLMQFMNDNLLRKQLYDNCVLKFNTHSSEKLADTILNL